AIPVPVSEHDRSRQGPRGNGGRRRRAEGPLAIAEEDGDVVGGAVGGDEVELPIPVHVSRGETFRPLSHDWGGPGGEASRSVALENPDDSPRSARPGDVDLP